MGRRRSATRRAFKDAEDMPSGHDPDGIFLSAVSFAIGP